MLDTQLNNIDESAVLGRAAMRAADKLGLSMQQLATIVGRDRTSISRRGIEPHSKSGELALLLVRCYRSLAVVGNDNGDQLRHWMQTQNRHTGGIPAEQIESVNGLVSVCAYLDAIRARV